MEQFQPLRTFFNNISLLNEPDWNYVADRLKIMNFSRGNLLTRQGSVENYTYFITRGVIRLYIESAVKDITLDIHFANDFANAYSSFLTRKPSHFNVQALTELEVIAISFQDLEDFYREIPTANYIARKMAEYTFIRKAMREVDLLTKSPTERYHDLLKFRPDILKYIPLNHIASYLGITPQALSRIRRKPIS